MIGYWLVQALHGAVPGQPVGCLICRTVVRADDPAFANPTKFVGPVYDEAQARQLAAERGWNARQDGQAWRRVVPSPEPVELMEVEMIRQLKDLTTAVLAQDLAADALVILTDVDAVEDGYGTPQARPIHPPLPDRCAWRWRRIRCLVGSVAPCARG